jgi:hypothetical protein
MGPALPMMGPALPSLGPALPSLGPALPSLGSALRQTKKAKTVKTPKVSFGETQNEITE